MLLPEVKNVWMDLVHVVITIFSGPRQEQQVQFCEVQQEWWKNKGQQPFNQGRQQGMHRF